MSSGEIICFEAMHYADSPVTDSFGVLVRKGATGGFSMKEWFSNKSCSYEKLGDGTLVKVSCPRWILVQKGIINVVTKI